ncbi:MAG: hypothetical protein R3A80_09700 [Bdellovibrionota bacterium]
MKKSLILALGMGLSLISTAGEVSGMNASQAKIRLKAVIEQLKEKADPETQKYLEELGDATNVILDNTQTPLYAIGIMGGVDGGVQFLSVQTGKKKTILGIGGQAIFGPIFTINKDDSGAKSLDVKGASLIGANLTAKRTDKAFEAGIQGQFGIVLIFAHNNKDGTPKMKRTLDMSGWYLGLAGEGAIPVFLLNRIRLNVGIYSLVNGDNFVANSGLSLLGDEAKKSLDAWKNKNFKEASAQSFESLKTVGSGSLSMAGKTIQSFLDDVIIGDATMVVLNGQIGSKDAPLELQAEALQLKLTQ